MAEARSFDAPRPRRLLLCFFVVVTRIILISKPSAESLPAITISLFLTGTGPRVRAYLHLSGGPGIHC